MATYTHRQLAQAQPGTSAGTLYTVPAATSTVVKQIVIANTTATAATVSIRLVPSGGSPGVGNSVAEAVSVAANTSQTLDLTQTLPTGAFISALQGTASAITLTISGVEIT